MPKPISLGVSRGIHAATAQRICIHPRADRKTKTACQAPKLMNRRAQSSPRGSNANLRGLCELLFKKSAGAERRQIMVASRKDAKTQRDVLQLSLRLGVFA